MADQTLIREFLMSRRARRTPEAAGLPTSGPNRRVPGLRREEAAALAGVSVDYYVRLERGAVAGVSESVLEGLCRALALDEAERLHLHDLVRATSTTPHPPRRPPARTVTPSVQRVLDSMVDSPAFVANSRLDLVATNALCAALYADLDYHTGARVNLARYTFLDPQAVDFYPEWDAIAEMTVALLRSSAGHDPDDQELTLLIGDLATHSEEFSRRWAAQHVQRHTSGRKRIHHPVVGDLELSFDSLDLAADPTLNMTIYTAEENTRSADALTLLGTWSASNHNNVSHADDAPRPPS